MLTAKELTALSVSKLEAELEANTYPAELLAEALRIENAKDEPRKTALEALTEAAASADDPAVESADDAPTTGHKVANGKSITTKAGILNAGDDITAKMLPGGERALKTLISKGYVK